MSRVDKVQIVAVNTVQFLATNREACPEFLGEVSSAEKAAKLAEKCDAVFNMAIINGKPIVRGNPRRLMPTVQAVAEANGFKLNDEELLDVCVAVVEEVGRNYIRFLEMSGEDFESEVKTQQAK